MKMMMRRRDGVFDMNNQFSPSTRIIKGFTWKLNKRTIGLSYYECGFGLFSILF